MTTAHDVDNSWLALILQDAPVEAYERLRSAQLATAATAAGRRRVDIDALRAEQVRSAVEEHRRRLNELNTVNDLALRLSGEHNLPALLQDTVTQARRVLDVDVAYLALIEPDGSLSIQVTDGSIGSRLRGIRLPAAAGLAGRVVEKAEPVHSADYVADHDLIHTDGVDQVARDEGLRTIVGTPLRLRGQVIGVLMVAQRAVRRFNSWELSLLSSLGAFAGVAIDTARQLAEHRRIAEELSAANHALELNVSSVNRAASLHDRLLEVALRGGGVDQVIYGLSEVISGQVLFLDDRDVAAVSARSGVAGSGAPATKIDGMWPSDRFSSPDQRRTWICHQVVTVPVASAHIYFGCVQVHAGQTPTSWDLRLLERAAMTIALVAGAERAEAEADRRNTTQMLEQLLTGRVDDEVAFRKRGLLLGLDLTVAHLIVAADPATEAGPSGSDPVALLVERFGGVAGRVAGRAVAAIRADLDSVRSGLRQWSSPLVVTIGLGGPASGQIGMAAAYQDALACLKTLDALSRRGSFASPSDLGPYRYLLSQAGRDDARVFVDATIGPLSAHDEAKHTDLVRTAEVFLAVGRQHSVAATQLHVHANTLYQRLDRITAVLGDGWRDGDRALEVQMALQVRRLLNNPGMTL